MRDGYPTGLGRDCPCDQPAASHPLCSPAGNTHPRRHAARRPGVIHTVFIHDFSEFMEVCETNRIHFAASKNGHA
jgi:hypothetical protein